MKRQGDVRRHTGVKKQKETGTPMHGCDGHVAMGKEETETDMVPLNDSRSPPPVMEQEHTMDIVTLNVGGRRFMTTTSTLCKFNGMFCKMFSDKWSVREESDGNVFIDRDGDAFGVVLNYMRSGSVDIPPALSVSQVQLELDYFFSDPPQLDAEDPGCDRFKNTMSYHMMCTFVEPLMESIKKLKLQNPGYDGIVVKEPVPGASQDLVIRIGEWWTTTLQGMNATMHFWYQDGYGPSTPVPKNWNVLPKACIGDIINIYRGKDCSMTLHDVRVVLAELFHCDNIFVSCGKVRSSVRAEPMGRYLMIRVLYTRP